MLIYLQTVLMHLAPVQPVLPKSSLSVPRPLLTQKLLGPTLGSSFRLRCQFRKVTFNDSPVVDIFAPGAFVTSSWIGSPNATNNISGTSMVCGLKPQTPLACES